MKKTRKEIKTDRRKGINFNTARIIPNPKEVIFKLISVICDNKEKLRFKKINGEFKVNLFGGANSQSYALSNLQMDADCFDLAWAADEGDWEKVVKLIETGTSVIESVKSR